MKIALVGYLHGSGGAERQIIMLANALAAYNHDVYLLILAQNNPCYEISDKVNRVVLTHCEKKYGVKIINRFLAYRNCIIKLQPDVTIHYWLQSAYFTAMIPSKKRGRIIYSERGDPYDSEYYGLLGIIRNVAFKQIDGFVFQSEGAKNFFDIKVKSRSIIIHNSVSVPIDKYLVPKVREQRIVSVGRLHPQKNQKLLIDAFACISSKYPEYMLDIYGDGALQDYLENQIEKLNLKKKITIYNSRKDIFDCIRKASLFVLSSDYEGMPNALMEAMALGLPCISTDCRPGGARTLIQDGENGFIVPTNDPKALAEKIEYVLSHKQEADRVALKAHDIMNTHTQQYIFDQWNSYIMQIVSKSM
ncbi:glycosyltransferase [Bacteroides oleiciplenus]|uniref:glycosyltransferase n=1 Tax=Bacteroides oleiciplenus TaxID=626931 RepID=UPI0026DDBED3|nr:glycosyltransferase [Bacteroides oleiciplenus]